METKKNAPISHSIKYVGGNEGINLSQENQKKVFGKWKLTNVIFFKT